MPEAKATLNMLGEEFPVTEVPVVERREPQPAEYRLQDGAVLRFDAAKATVYRLDGQYDSEGHPLYVVKSSNTMDGDVMVLINATAFSRSAAPVSGREARDAMEKKEFSTRLINFFTTGITVFVIGIALLLWGGFTSNDSLHIAGAALSAIGSVVFALALLHGQDITERRA